jgi:DNA-directed RNA polymerase subunit RPC12/RpoP
MGEAVYLKMTCLKCGGSVEFPEESEGANVLCPICGKDLFLYRGVRAVGATAAPAPKPKSAEKMFYSTCNFCGEYIGFPESMTGETVRCQSCGRQILLPYGAQEGRFQDKEAQELVHPRTNTGKNFKTPCEHCGAHVEFAPELEGTTILCPHCRKNKVLLRRFVRSETVGTPANSPPQQKISGSPTPDNPNADMSLIGQVVWGFVVGIIAALGIGLACLLASKMGWDGLGKHVSSAAADFWFSLLVLAVFFAVIIFFQKKKTQTFKDAIKAEACYYLSCVVPMFICLHLTISLFYSPPPAKPDVDYGVNWALATDYRIEWQDSRVNIFDVYMLSNQYIETVGPEKHFVYDFIAQCPLIYVRLDEYGNQSYRQGRGSPNSVMTTLSGSVTLVKKGKMWYYSRTIRVH